MQQSSGSLKQPVHRGVNGLSCSLHQEEYTQQVTLRLEHSDSTPSQKIWLQHDTGHVETSACPESVVSNFLKAQNNIKLDTHVLTCCRYSCFPPLVTLGTPRQQEHHLPLVLEMRIVRPYSR